MTYLIFGWNLPGANELKLQKHISGHLSINDEFITFDIYCIEPENKKDMINMVDYHLCHADLG